MTRDASQVAEAAAAAMWRDDRACQALGMELLEVGEGVAEMAMTVQEHMVNGHNICHGGYLFTLADSAFAYACNSRNLITVAAGARIDFLRPAKLGERLTASARVVHQGKRTGVYDATVKNAAGQSVAEFRGNSATIGGALAELPAGEDA